MKRSRFDDEFIIAILKQQETGMATPGIAGKMRSAERCSTNVRWSPAVNFKRSPMLRKGPISPRWPRAAI